jgi:hypothetical protein
MSKTARALELAQDIASMFEYWQDDIVTGSYTVNDFCQWAIQQHETHACQTIGIDRAGLKDLMNMWYDYERQLSNLDDDYEDNYQEIAIALFRYYLQAYKAEFDLNAEQLQELGYINTLKVVK